MLPRYKSVEEVMNATAELRDELALRGARESAQRLTEALECFYTTASEALGEIREALESTRASWGEHLSSRYQALGDHAITEATRLLRMG